MSFDPCVRGSCMCGAVLSDGHEQSQGSKLLHYIL